MLIPKLDFGTDQSTSREKVSTSSSIFKTGVLLTEDDGRDVYIRTTLRCSPHNQISNNLKQPQGAAHVLHVPGLTDNR